MNNNVIMNMKAQMQPEPAVIDQLMSKIALLDTDEYIDTTRRSKGKIRMGYMVATAAAIGLMVAGVLCTDIGKSVAERIESWLKPQKVSQTIEGYEDDVVVVPSYDYEKTNVAEGMAEYVIYYDREIFASERKNGKETIYGLANKDATMTIEQVENISAKKELEAIINSEKIKDYEKSEELESSYDYEGIWYATGLEYDDIMYRIYTIDNGKGGCFIIRTKNTVEADEGFGSQFKEMLQDFLIVQ